MRTALGKITRRHVRAIVTDGRDLARRFTQIVRGASGRPPVTDDDETVRVVPRRDDGPRTVRRPLFDTDDEE